jgi:hypothetical protein
MYVSTTFCKVTFIRFIYIDTSIAIGVNKLTLSIKQFYFTPVIWWNFALVFIFFDIIFYHFSEKYTFFFRCLHNIDLFRLCFKLKIYNPVT